MIENHHFKKEWNSFGAFYFGKVLTSGNFPLELLFSSSVLQVAHQVHPLLLLDQLTSASFFSDKIKNIRNNIIFAVQTVTEPFHPTTNCILIYFVKLTIDSVTDNC